MSRELRAALVLALLAPALAELLSGSSPPLRFFHPVGLLVLALLYGGGALLIREARARWRLGWPVALLAVAFGVLEEGTAIQSFFNHHHEDLQGLARYGVLLGVQWPWAILVTFFHATVSTLVPIAIVDGLFPDLRSRPLLGARGLALCALGLLATVPFFWIAVWSGSGGAPDPYSPSPVLVVGSAAVAFALVAAAFLLRGRRGRTRALPLAPPLAVGAACFVAEAANAVAPHLVAGAGAPGWVAVLVQATGLVLALAFVRLQLLHRDLSRRHVAAAVTGALLPFVLVAPAQQLGQTTNPDPTDGMLVVGLGAAALLALWRRRMLDGA